MADVPALMYRIVNNQLGGMASDERTFALLQYFARVDEDIGEAASSRVAFRRWLTRAEKRIDCMRCGFPVNLTGCGTEPSNCRVSDPSSRLAWVDGHPASIVARVAMEATAARYHLLSLAAPQPEEFEVPKGDVWTADHPDGVMEVCIALAEPVTTAARLPSLRSYWNCAPLWNRQHLASSLDRVIEQARLATARSNPGGELGCGPADDPDDPWYEEPVDPGAWLTVMSNDGDGAGLADFVYNLWLAPHLARARPELLLETGKRLADYFGNVHDIEHLLDAVAHLVAAALKCGRTGDAGLLLIEAWTLYVHYQTEQATSDAGMVADRIAPVLTAWSMMDVGAWALATMLASDVWVVTISEPGSPATVTCRPRDC